jgi:hypothetical protein
VALTEIGARLRLAGAPAFTKDAHKGADALGRMGKQAGYADKKVTGLERAAKRSRSALAGVAKGAAFGAIGVAATGIGALSVGLIQGFKDAAAMQTMLAKTNAVVKSTGGVANVSARGVFKMSDQLESLSMIDQNAILNGENLLLTFTNVRNGVGQSNHIFDQATAAMVNMASAMGSDPQTAAIQLGKALNDPVKGVTALSKVGVSFTAQQKKQIKTLVAHGKTMQAQKIILKELNTEFGGAAKAAGSGFEGALFRAKDALGDLFRDVATPLLPGFTKKVEDLSTFLSTKATPAILNFVKGFQDKTGAGGAFRQDLADIARNAREAWPQIKSVFEKTKAFIDFLGAHPEIVKGAATAVAAFAVGMKASAIASAAMAISGPGAATGIGAVGAASSTAMVGLAPFALAAGALLVSLQEIASTNLLTHGLDKQVKALKEAGDPTASTAAAKALGVRPGSKPGEFIFDPKSNKNKRDRGIQMLDDATRFSHGPAVATFNDRTGKRTLVPKVPPKKPAGAAPADKPAPASKGRPVHVNVVMGQKVVGTAVINDMEDRMARN